MSTEASGSPRFSFASGANATYIDELYQQYLQDPSSVDASWQSFFKGYEFGLQGDGGSALAGEGGAARAAGAGDASAEEIRDNAKVEALINAYRRLGHLSADLNPLAEERPSLANLLPENHGLKDVSGDRVFRPANLPRSESTLNEIMELLQSTYCGKIGADFRETNDIEAVKWFQEKMEEVRNRPAFPVEVKRRVLQKLVEAEGFEQFLGRRYIGQKRFSLEGLESLIPMLDVVATNGAREGVEEICVGMAHRGRLNVLANFMGKSYEMMLKEFEGSEFNPFDIDGDVKYHMGFASEVQTGGGDKMRLCLSPNPSHLEAVNPVVQGFVRARQNLLEDASRSHVLPILMHGDAAFMGQGIVAETFNLSDLASYSTGGTIHIITNNQVGFTADPHESRTGHYASEVSKMVRAPVLHVNADDPEAAIWSAELAIAYRQKFARDIVIDLIGYRRHGHNEGDEPAFTQPLMYKKIAKHKTVLSRYIEALDGEGSVSSTESKDVVKAFKARMQEAYETVHGKTNPKIPPIKVPASLQKSMEYRKVARPDVDAQIETGVSGRTLKALAKKMTTPPDGFVVHKKLARLLESRQKMIEPSGGVDWGFGELLAFASLAKEGYDVRISGQDAQRGTFTSRHAVWNDVETGAEHNSMDGLGKGQGRVDIINSPLSENGCLGFEFGYSVADPGSLVCWEAQFGDFANGAQIVFDQFVSASEAKWKQCSSLVVLLPHGHEGQGPEHSSARPERFLQLCGNLNMQVVIPTTPAQHFHAIRRQMSRDFRKPLIVMTPKSLLRLPECVSSLKDFEKGCFREVIDDDLVKNKKNVERIVACSGKIYYELLRTRAENPQLAEIPIVRLEQLYPFPYERIKEVFAVYPKLKEIVWTQEEPQNMGGWNFARGRFVDIMDPSWNLRYVGRKNSGTPAEGSGKAHEAEQQRILRDAFGLACGWEPKVVKKA